ncbi:ATP-NAD kinase-like domain-containing protein [Peziza echinospora]|nr:ATP-NAD kinase-like domain-containing protein [Peziza echinospora]
MSDPSKPEPVRLAVDERAHQPASNSTLDTLINLKIREKPPREKADDNDRDPEYQEVEVLFDPGITSKHRRRSSNVNASSRHSYNSSSCFVHALLEAQRAAEAGSICEIDEELHKNEELGPDPGIASRTLTKIQLTDLALGVRELSKRFVSMEIRMKVKTFFLLTKPREKDLTQYTREVIYWLLSNEKEQYIVYIDEKLKGCEELDTDGLIKENPTFANRIHYWTPELCVKRPHTFDFVITLGGDGTVLYASWLFQKVVPPVLSFALGSLGFLTKFNYKLFPSILDHALNEGITISLRLRFEGTVMRSLRRERGNVEGCDLSREILGIETDGPTHRPAESMTILNEVVVDRGPNPTMSSTELYGDDEHLSSILADGICISTPTGSTAYSLAAGGSLCHPEIPSMLVSPICAHSLTFRPLILPDSMVLRVGVPYDARTTAWASFDGRQRVELNQGDYVTISASRFPFPMIQNRKQNKDWFNSISRNFNWGARQKQKPLDWL